MFKLAGIVLTCLALCLAGCSTAPTENSPEAVWPPAPWPPAPIATNAPPKVVPRPALAAATNNIPPLRLQLLSIRQTNTVTNLVVKVKVPAQAAPAPPPAVQVTNVSHPAVQFNVPPPAVSRPVLTWTSLNLWANQQGFTAPQRLSGTALVRYALESLSGVLALEIGSRDITWNGIVVHLGFAPEIIDDQVFVHGLDLEKTIQPLLCGKPFTACGNRVIVIDPGHGGIQSGALSVYPGGRSEKMFTLDWALRLAPLLEAKGWNVMLTRTNDSDIAVSNRVAFADAHHPSLFISLHFNSYPPDPSQAGLETYCLTPTGLPSFITRGYPDIITQNFPANFYDRDSLLLAVQLQKSILHATGEEDRGVRRARFLGILRGQQCPCVLIEGGYLSNPREAQKIETPAYRQKLAEAVAAALK